MTVASFFLALFAEPGLRLEYISKGGEMVMVATPGAYDSMLDLLEQDWAGPKQLKGEVLVRVYHPEGYVKKEEDFLDKDKPAPAKPAEPEPEATKPPKKPLDEVCAALPASLTRGCVVFC